MLPELFLLPLEVESCLKLDGYEESKTQKTNYNPFIDAE
jgi:hypothetical protein